MNRLTMHWAAVALMAVGVGLASALASSAEVDSPTGGNWTRFRGPNGSGIATEGTFPSQWTQADYLWRVPLAAVGHSSPVAWEDLLLVTSGDSEQAQVILQALDAATGEELWSRTFQNEVHRMHQSNSYASSSPCVDAERIYLTWASPESYHVAAVDHRGEIVWRRNLGNFVEKHGFGSSPVLIEGLLIIAGDHAGDSFVAALDPATGDPVWRIPRESGIASFASPVVWRGRDGPKSIVVNSSGEGMVGIAPSTGAVQWRVPGVYPERCVASPVVGDELVFGGSGSGSNGHSMVCVRPPSAPGEQPGVVETLTKSVPQVPTPIVVGDTLFIWHDRGVVSCRDAATLREYWTQRVGGNYYGSPICAGGKLYCMSREGDAIVLAAEKKYQLLGRNSLGEATHATPAVHRNRMYLRTESTLACLPAEKP